MTRGKTFFLCDAVSAPVTRVPSLASMLLRLRPPRCSRCVTRRGCRVPPHQLVGSVHRRRRHRYADRRPLDRRHRHENVLLRGIGPALVPFGIAGAVGDPQLALFSGTTQIDANDNWGGTAALATAFTSVGAFPLSSTSSTPRCFVHCRPAPIPLNSSTPAAPASRWSNATTPRPGRPLRGSPMYPPAASPAPVRTCSRSASRSPATSRSRS